jgi:hypothetical protein
MAGYASIIVIKNKDNVHSEIPIFEALGLTSFSYSEEANLDEVYQPKDNSVSIAFFKDYIIICDDFRFTDLFFTHEASEEEESLLELFPNSDMLSVCFMGNIDFKGYAIIKKGHKIRFKTTDDSSGIIAVQKKMDDEQKEELAIFEYPDFEFMTKIVLHSTGLDLESDDAHVLYDNYTFKKYIPVSSEDFDEEDEDDADNVEAEAKSDSGKPWWQFWK